MSQVREWRGQGNMIRKKQKLLDNFIVGLDRQIDCWHAVELTVC